MELTTDMVAVTETKRCTKCGEVKHVSEFTKARGNRDGLQAWCKECFRFFNRERYRRLHPEREFPVEKRCSGCGETKPLEEFSRCRSRDDGHHHYCKKCRSEEQLARVQKQTPIARASYEQLVASGATKVCSICKKERLVLEFNFRSYSKDGVNLYCRECASIKSKGNLERVRERHQRTRCRLIQEGAVKRCHGCQEVKPLSDFSASTSSADGTSVYCRPCAADKKRTDAGRFGCLKNSARRRGFEVDMTLEQYRELTVGKNCHYCGGKLPESGSGLDRIDSRLGYSVANVVTCCDECNTAKNSTFTYDEFMLLSPVLREIRRMRDSRKEATNGPVQCCAA